MLHTLASANVTAQAIPARNVTDLVEMNIEDFNCVKNDYSFKDLSLILNAVNVFFKDYLECVFSRTAKSDFRETSSKLGFDDEFQAQISKYFSLREEAHEVKEVKDESLLASYSATDCLDGLEFFLDYVDLTCHIVADKPKEAWDAEQVRFFKELQKDFAAYRKILKEINVDQSLFSPATPTRIDDSRRQTPLDSLRKAMKDQIVSPSQLSFCEESLASPIDSVADMTPEETLGSDPANNLREVFAAVAVSASAVLVTADSEAKQQAVPVPRSDSVKHPSEASDMFTAAGSYVGDDPDYANIPAVPAQTVWQRVASALCCCCGIHPVR